MIKFDKKKVYIWDNISSSYVNNFIVTFERIYNNIRTNNNYVFTQ